MQQKIRRAFVGCGLVALCGIPVYAQNTPSPPEHAEELHPALRWLPPQIEEYIQKGQQYAQKNGTFTGMTNKYRQNPSWTRGKGGKSHESYVWALNLDGLPIIKAGFESAKKYEALKLPDNIKTTGAYVKKLWFQVLLTSVPHIARNRFQKERSADEQDVTAVKFVLSDDQGHDYEAVSNEIGRTDGTVTFSGSSPNTTTGTVDTSGSSTAKYLFNINLRSFEIEIIPRTGS